MLHIKTVTESYWHELKSNASSHRFSFLWNKHCCHRSWEESGFQTTALSSQMFKVVTVTFPRAPFDNKAVTGQIFCFNILSPVYLYLFCNKMQVILTVIITNSHESLCRFTALKSAVLKGLMSPYQESGIQVFFTSVLLIDSVIPFSWSACHIFLQENPLKEIAS